MLAGLDIYLDRGKNITVTTFGQPRLGNDDFVSFLNRSPIVFNRVVQEGDPVPLLPSKWTGYFHTKDSFVLKKDTVTPCAVDEMVDDPKICLGTWLTINPKKHTGYFNYRPSCTYMDNEDQDI